MRTIEQAAARRDRLRREADRQLAETIRRELAAGVTATRAAERAGMTRPTLYRLLRAQPVESR